MEAKNLEPVPRTPMANAIAARDGLLADVLGGGTKVIETVDHPVHYGGKDNPYEVIKVIEAWEAQNPHLGFNLLTAITYIGRAGLKGPMLEDLKKARWYIERQIRNLEGKAAP